MLEALWDAFGFRLDDAQTGPLDDDAALEIALRLKVLADPNCCR